MIEKFHYSVLTIALIGDYEVIYQRFRERNISPDRHRGHVVNDCYPEIDKKDTETIITETLSYSDYLYGIEHRGVDRFSVGERIKVDTTDFSKIDMVSLLTQIENWRKRKMILETKRLYLREMNQSDYDALYRILQDEEVMYAYNGAFNDEETQAWLDKQIARYHEYGFGLWAVILKETGEMIGQCGLTMQLWKNRDILEIGYLFQKNYWHKGYAIEAAKACAEDYIRFIIF